MPGGRSSNTPGAWRNQPPRPDLTPPCRQPRSGPSLTWSSTWARPSTGSRRSSSGASPTPHSCPRRWPYCPPTPTSGRRGCRSPRSGSRARARMMRSTRRCSNPAADERSGTRFWISSLLNEAVIHGFDAANAADRPADIDADIAAALISNHLTMLTSPTWEMQRSESAHAIRGTGQTLQWLATDTADDAGAWFVERRPDVTTWQPATQQADVTVTGPARSLLLTLTRRLALTDREATNISVDGDTDLAQHWLDNTAHVSG